MPNLAPQNFTPKATPDGTDLFVYASPTSTWYRSTITEFLTFVENNITVGVSPTGSPIADYLAVWTAPTTITGTADLIFNSTDFQISTHDLAVIQSAAAVVVSAQGTASATLDLQASAASLDEKIYRMVNNGAGVLQFNTYTDAGALGSTIFNVNRTATAVDDIDFSTNALLAGSYNGVALTTAGAAANFLNEEGNYVPAAGGGDVSISGTPVANQIAVWNTPTSIEGLGGFEYTGTLFEVAAVTSTIQSSNITELITKTNSNALYSEVSARNDTTAIGALRTDSSSSVDTRLGITLANYTVLESYGTASLGLIISTTGTNDINIGTNDTLSAVIDGTTQNWDLQANDLATTGNITAANFNGVTLDDGGAATSYLDQTGNYSVPPTGTGDVTVSGPAPSSGQLAVWSSGTAIGGTSVLNYSSGTLNVNVAAASNAVIQAFSSLTTGSASFRANSSTAFIDVISNGTSTAGTTLGVSNFDVTTISATNAAGLNILTVNNSAPIRIGTSGTISATIDGSTQDWDFHSNDLTTTGGVTANNLILADAQGINFDTGGGLNGSIFGFTSDLIFRIASGGQIIIRDNAATQITTIDGTSHDWDFLGNNLTDIGKLNLGSSTVLTIAAGVITVTKSYHQVDTEGGAGTDDLDTINGGVTGDMLILRSTAGGRDVTVKDSTGNLLLEGDFTLSTTSDTITLFFDGSWRELSRSNNA